MAICLFATINELFFRDIIDGTHEDVLLDGRVEKNRFLAHNTDVLAKPFHVQTLYVDAVNSDGTRNSIIETLDERDGS